jgi:eukaryotic-like serine/threonine-protein kinase
MVDSIEKVFDEEDEVIAEEQSDEQDSSPQMSDASAEEKDTKDKEDTFLEIAGFLKKYTTAPAVRGRKDMLNDRYLIKPGNPIEGLSKPLSVACEAEDENIKERSLYAMLVQKDLPYRIRNMEALSGVDHPNLLQLAAVGTVEFSGNDSCQMTAVIEKPQGRTIRQVLTERKAVFTEQFVIDEIIAPLTEVLLIFSEKGISHASINLDTVYYSEHVQLGECVSQPPGFSQHFHFESPERSQAEALGKGEATIAADCYALGVLVMHMVLGLRYFERIDERQYLNKRLTLGTFNAVIGGREFKALEDFFKGVLNDDANERWTPEHIDQWVKGKKYNLLTPSVLREGQRPFQFLGEDYLNRRALAHSLAQNWEEAKPVLRNNHLSRWVEVSLHKIEMAEAIRKIMEKTGGAHGASEKSSNELVARTICILDPDGPLRYNMLSSFVDGLGTLLADAIRERDQKRIHACVEVLDHNFFSFLNELQDGAKNKRYGNLLWRMQNSIRYLRMQAMGFGIERILYELNPNLPCQSPLLINDNALTTEKLLFALDRIGSRKAKNFEYLDRHIAAFIATKMDITKEVKLAQIKQVPALAQNPQLIVISMLAQAQRKTGRPKLKGLTSWTALRVLPLIDNFHSRSIRRKLRANLKTAARSGELENIIDCITDAAAVADDMQGFQKAVQLFTKNTKKITKLENRKRLEDKANRHGMTFALIVSYSTLLITVAVVIKNFFLG